MADEPEEKREYAIIDRYDGGLEVRGGSLHTKSDAIVLASQTKYSGIVRVSGLEVPDLSTVVMRPSSFKQFNKLKRRS